MSINYTMVAVIMLFVILISIQFTLNKIFMILKEIKEEFYQTFKKSKGEKL